MSANTCLHPFNTVRFQAALQDLCELLGLDLSQTNHLHDLRQTEGRLSLHALGLAAKQASMCSWGAMLDHCSASSIFIIVKQNFTKGTNSANSAVPELLELHHQGPRPGTMFGIGWHDHPQ